MSLHFSSLDDLNLAMSLKRVLSQELVSPRRGIRTMRQMLAVPILDFSGGRQGNCAPGSALVWTWVPHGVTAGGLEAAPVTDLVRQMELDTLATYH